MLSDAVTMQHTFCESLESNEAGGADRFAEFADYVNACPHAPRQKLADQFGVSRQTIQMWLRRMKSNDPVGRRGRPSKFKGHRSQLYSIRVPAELLAQLGAATKSGDKDVRRQVRRIIEDAAFEALSAHACQLAKAG